MSVTHTSSSHAGHGQSSPCLGAIGGSGLYAIDELEQVERVRVDTPYGQPSDELVKGVLRGCPVVFLPRHGRNHRLTPSEIPYRANIWAMKKLGVDRILSVTAVGSMKEALAPGSLVAVDQFIDRTVRGERTFFTDGCVGHVSMADPTCPRLAAAMANVAEAAGLAIQRGGTYVCIEGPQFSTRAESRLFRSWGVDVIGMTNLPESRLAREAELPYATLALVTDYDCWHADEADVSAESVMAVLRDNTGKAMRILTELAEATATGAYSLDGSPAHGALQHAVMTPWDAVPAATRERLSLILGRV